MRPRLHYESTTFRESPYVLDLLAVVPGARHALYVAGVPTSFMGRRYAADTDVAILRLPSSNGVVRFGSTGISGAIGIQLPGGEVVEVVDESRGPVLFVNTSLSQFTNTVRAMIERFPYYSQNAPLEETEAISRELLGVIAAIDPAAATADKYWSTFTDDVAIGDLSTEAVMATCLKGSG